LQGRNPARMKTFIMRAGKLFPIPEGFSGLVPTNFEALAQSALVSPEGQRRMMQDLEMPSPTDEGDESVGAFISRRLGREAFDHLIEPLMGGIYAGDADQLSLEATFPQLRQVEKTHGSLIRGLQTQASSEATDYPPFVALRTGMGDLVTALQERLTMTDLILGIGVSSLATAAAGGYRVTLENGRALHADALILTTPAYVTARLVEPLDARLAAAHAAIPYGSTAIVTLAFDEAALPHPLDGYGYVIPRIEGTDVTACTWSSSKWDNRAPAGAALA
jgi:protoporphyrinogen/coproporphyrinogen III oxidase